jgi:serine protease inhibitor
MYGHSGFAVQAKGGAETATSVERKSPYTTPFIFLIRDIETGAILVAGRVLNPTA